MRRRVQLRTTHAADRTIVWQCVASDLTQLVISQQLAHVTLEQAEEPLEQSPGGTFREIIPLQ